jgi:glucose dehydrogenase
MLRLFPWLAFSICLSAPAQEWPVYGGDPGNTRYSRLKQIDRSNVVRLRTAWTFRTGD